MGAGCTALWKCAKDKPVGWPWSAATSKLTYSQLLTKICLGGLMRNTDWHRVVFPNHGRSKLIDYHDYEGESRPSRCRVHGLWSKSKIIIGSKMTKEPSINVVLLLNSLLHLLQSSSIWPYWHEHPYHQEQSPFDNIPQFSTIHRPGKIESNEVKPNSKGDIIGCKPHHPKDHMFLIWRC